MVGPRRASKRGGRGSTPGPLRPCTWWCAECWRLPQARRSPLIVPQAPCGDGSTPDYCHDPLAMPLEEAFQTDLELQTSHQRTVVLDELDYLLEGARPHWPPQQRVPCLQRLHEWLGADRHADAIMRTEHRAPLVLQAAAAFDPQNPALARPCLLLLLHVVGDPRNHGLVGEEVWGAFLQVLATSPACGLPGGSPYKLPLAKRARSPGANESAGGLKRKRSFLGGASVAASKAANPTEDESKNNQVLASDRVNV